MLRIFSIIILVVFLSCASCSAQLADSKTVKLPPAKHDGAVSVEKAIFERRSVRNFTEAPLTLEEVSQLLWAAGGSTIDGVTGPTRAYPSAGAVYPLEIYLVAGSVTGLKAGVYHYDWKANTLTSVKEGDLRPELSRAAFGQRMVEAAPATIVITALYDKTTMRYGRRGGERYVGMDAGHLGQNVHLEAHSLGLGTVMVGAFTDTEVLKVIGRSVETPVYMMPVGKPRQ